MSLLVTVNFNTLEPSVFPISMTCPSRNSLVIAFILCITVLKKISVVIFRLHFSQFDWSLPYMTEISLIGLSSSTL